jgi:hypothetical protein
MAIIPIMLLSRTSCFGFILSFFYMAANDSAMVSTGIKSSELSIKHLAKTFYFVLSFHF